MAEVARVLDIDVIRSFRANLVKFIESSSAAVVDGEAEILKKMSWLEGEQVAHWQNELRRLHELVNRCKDAVRQKKIFKDSTGKPGSAIDEEKALKKAQALYVHAEEKLANTKKHARQLQREHMMYRGGVQRFQTMLASDLPKGVQMLENVLVKLDAYLSGGATAAVSTAGGERPAGAADGEGDGNMKRAAEHEGETVGDQPADAPAEAVKSETVATHEEGNKED